MKVDILLKKEKSRRFCDWWGNPICHASKEYCFQKIWPSSLRPRAVVKVGGEDFVFPIGPGIDDCWAVPMEDDHIMDLIESMVWFLWSEPSIAAFNTTGGSVWVSAKHPPTTSEHVRTVLTFQAPQSPELLHHLSILGLVRHSSFARFREHIRQMADEEEIESSRFMAKSQDYQSRYVNYKRSP